MKSYKVLIIGAGRIAAEYDSPDSPHVLTHCHALVAHPRFHLIGLYDHHRKAALRASKKWHATAIAALEDCERLDADIIAICTPDHTHASYLETALRWRPLLVVCEKPLTLIAPESERITEMYEAANVPLSVVYQRRFDPDVNSLRNDVQSNRFGAFLTGTLLYSKGILHNGSHGVDLLIYLFGDVLHAEYHSHRVDYVTSDPTISARLRFDAGDVYLLAADERHHSLFELDLIFEKGRFRFLDSGLTIEVHHVADDPTFPGYKALLPVTKRSSTLTSALYSMWDEIATSLDNNTPLPTNARQALLSQKVCTHLLQQATGGCA